MPYTDAQKQIRAIRARTGLSQEAFSRVYEIPRRTIQDWEAGRRNPPPYMITMLARIIEILPPEKIEDPG